MAALLAAVLFVKLASPWFWALLALAALAVQFSGLLAGMAWRGRRQVGGRTP